MPILMAWLLLTVLQFLSYNVLIDFQATGRWHFDPTMQWLTYSPFYALLIGRALWEHRFGATVEQGAHI